MRMGTHRSGIVVATFIAAIGLAGCSTSSEAEAEPTEPSRESPSADPTVEGESAPVAESSEDEWGDAMRDEHIDGLMDWWNEHHETDCDLTETECVEHFSQGAGPMSAFADDVRNSGSDQPDYVPAFYAGEVAQASMQMESYMHACLDRDQCSVDAGGLEQDVYELISEAHAWFD